MTLKELKELAEKATPGPWFASYSSILSATESAKDEEGGWEHYFVGSTQATHGDTPDRPRDTNFIAAANPLTVLQLIERLEKLTTLIKAVTDEGMYEDQSGPLFEEALSLCGFEVPLK